MKLNNIELEKLKKEIDRWDQSMTYSLLLPKEVLDWFTSDTAKLYFKGKTICQECSFFIKQEG